MILEFQSHANIFHRKLIIWITLLWESKGSCKQLVLLIKFQAFSFFVLEFQEVKCFFSLCSSSLHNQRRINVLTLQPMYFFIFSVATSTNSSLAQWCWDLGVSQNHLDVFLKRRLLGTTPVSDSICLEWGKTVSISNKFPGDAAAAGLGPTLWEPRVLLPHVPLKGPHRKCSELRFMIAQMALSALASHWRLLSGGKKNNGYDSLSFQALPATKLKTEKGYTECEMKTARVTLSKFWDSQGDCWSQDKRHSYR